MAIPQYYLTHYPTTKFNLVKCCGNPKCGGVISTDDEYAYIHSRNTTKFYCDMVCMAAAEGFEIDMLDDAQRKYLMEELDAEYVG